MALLLVLPFLAGAALSVLPATAAGEWRSLRSSAGSLGRFQGPGGIR